MLLVVVVETVLCVWGARRVCVKVCVVSIVVWFLCVWCGSVVGGGVLVVVRYGVWSFRIVGQRRGCGGVASMRSSNQ